jgi:hypothetical protein
VWGRLTGRARRQQGPGAQRRGAGESEREQGSTVPAGSVLNSVLNQFKNIQTVQMKFKFLKILVGSKDTFPHSKNLKSNKVGKSMR